MRIYRGLRPLIAICFAAGSLLLAYPASALEGRAILSKDLALDYDSLWRYYVGDIIEGGYLGWLRPGTNQLSATVRLTSPLPTGTYNVFVKVAVYDAPFGSMAVSLGSATGSMSTTNGDWNGYWAGPVNLITPSTADSITVRVTKTADSSGTQRIVLGGLYVTTNLNENFVAGQTDRVVERLSVTIPPPAAIPFTENLVPNSSFEVGLGHGWGFQASGYDRDPTFADFVSNQHAYHGNQSFGFGVPGILVSRAIPLRRSGRYSLSFWAKAASNTPFFAEVMSAWGPPTGQVGNGSRNLFNASTTWQRYSITTNLYIQPGAEHHIRFDVRTTNVWIDAVQLQEELPIDYRPAKAFEIGITTRMPGNLYDTGDRLELQVHGIGYYEALTNRQVSLNIYNVFGRSVYSADLAFTAPVSTRSTQLVTLPNIGTGAFRAVVEDRGLGGAAEELSFSVVPKAPLTPPTTGAKLGIHPNLSTFQLDLNRKMGFSDLRVLSPAATFRWTQVEPSEGQFVWFDKELDRASTRGYRILGNIGGGNSSLPWPRWADNGGLPNLTKWFNYVEQVVTHYKGRVHYWEVWNEPLYTFSKDFYVELLRGTSNIIRRIDPNAKIVGMGGVYSKDWVKDVLTLLGPDYKQYLDVVSTHLYPPKTDPSGGDTEDRARLFKTEVADPFAVEVWNTETGVWDEGFYRGPNSGFALIGESLWPFRDSERFQRGSHYEATRLLANLVHCLGNGLNTYYYYDSRFYARPDYRATHCTLLEFDDSIRPKGIAYSIASSQLGGFSGLGNISPDTNSIFYLFSKNSDSCAVAWTRKFSPREIQMETSGLSVLDMMGNSVNLQPSRIRLGWLPQYIVAKGINSSDLRSRIISGNFTAATDTSVPFVGIDQIAVVPGPTAQIQARWMATDETDMPSAENPLALVYSFGFEGPSLPLQWSAWSPDIRTSRSFQQPGQYTLRVKTRDSSGNVSQEASRTFFVRNEEIMSARPIPPRNIGAK